MRKPTKVKRNRKCFLLAVLTLILSLFPLSSYAKTDYSFHGYMESNIIVRDTDGVQYGFFDSAEAIQQRNTLKFDIDVFPDSLRWGPFWIDKAHLTFRGAYDSIFAIRNDEYDSIPDERGPSRFDFGKDDIETEMDLREASFDLNYDGDYGFSFLRLGRQLVSWGEVTGATILDRINPSDGSFMVSAFPDELATPLWMGRLNYSLPPTEFAAFNFDLLYIPDVRPTQFGPLDESMSAPYVRNLPFAQLSELWGNPYFVGIEEDVPNRDEYAVRVSAELGGVFNLSLVYMETANDDPGILLTDVMDFGGGVYAPNKAILEHPYTKTYGGYFSYFNQFLDLVVRGEFGYTEDAPVDLASPDVIPGGSTGLSPIGTPYAPFDLQQYRLKDTYGGMIGVDKKIWFRPISPDSMITTSFQYIRSGIRDLDADMEVNHRDYNDVLSAQLSTSYYHGLIEPVIFVMYDTAGSWMGNANLTYTIDANWKVVGDLLTFFGDNDNRGTFSSRVGGLGYESFDQFLFKIIYQW